MPLAISPPTSRESSSPKTSPIGPLGTVPLWRSGVLVALAAAMLAIAYIKPASTGAPKSGVDMTLPNIINCPLPNNPHAEFYGSTAPVSEGELGILPSDTQIVRKDYDNFRESESIRCTILLSGAEQRSIHRAEVCLPGQGWTIVSQENVPISLASGHEFVVRNLAIQRDTVGQDNQNHMIHAFFMYWFVGENITTPSQFMRVFLNSWDRILYDRAYRWAYIMVMSSVSGSLRPDGLNATQTQAMLTHFIRNVVPTFQKSEMPDQNPH